MDLVSTRRPSIIIVTNSVVGSGAVTCSGAGVRRRLSGLGTPLNICTALNGRSCFNCSRRVARTIRRTNVGTLSGRDILLGSSM